MARRKGGAPIPRNEVGAAQVRRWPQSTPEELSWACLMAVLSQAAYAPDPVAAAHPSLGASLGGTWRLRLAAAGAETGYDVVLICESSSLVLVAYRGTTAIDADRSSESVATTVRGWYDNVSGVRGGDHHTAFRRRAASTIDDVTTAVIAARQRGARVLLAGHSAGGAIALMAALHLRGAVGDVDRLYTFGAPMAGGRRFVAGLRDMPILRCELGNDPVPWLPNDYDALLTPVGNPAGAPVLAAVSAVTPASVVPRDWCHAGVLLFLHPPGLPIRPNHLATSTGYGLSVAADAGSMGDASLAQARRETRTSFRDDVADHSVDAYVTALGALAGATSSAGAPIQRGK